MRKHSGMRPHDIAVLLKIACKGKTLWLMKDIAQELYISASEISESLHRSVIAGLIGNDKKTLNKLAIIDFLQSGIRYIYPQQPGALVRGIATAHSSPPLNNLIASNEPFVWPHIEGNLRGQAIEPLHQNIPKAALRDTQFYEYISLVDAIRAGKAREREMAHKIIREKIKNA